MNDIVIVGGGSAGCILASRLSEDPWREVLLLEAGPSFLSFPEVLVDPDRMGPDEYDWGTAGTRDGIPLRRGKVLGGSSTVNAAVAIRARSSDFERWSRAGIEGWSLTQIQESFDKLLVPVVQPPPESLTPGCQRFISGAMENGLALVTDFNGPDSCGVGPHPRNVSGGVRVNAAMAYLTHSVRARPNLEVRGDTHVVEILFDGSRATGVYLSDGRIERGGEVILAAGVYGSAAILLRSGIGPADDLRALGIRPVADLPVGLRLMDHPLLYRLYSLKPNASRRVPVVGALVWTRSSIAVPGELDLQITATHFADPSLSPTGSAIGLGVSVTLPESRGTVTLVSRDTMRIDSRFLSEEPDRQRLEEALHLAERIAGAPAFRDLIECELESPGLRSYHHGTSTAPMGEVVDSTGRVYGIQGLRIADASILPEIPSAPTNLTVIMVAERIAAAINSCRNF